MRFASQLANTLRTVFSKFRRIPMNNTSKLSNIEWSLIKQIARGIEYHALNELIDQTITIHGVQSAQSEVLTFVSAYLSGSYTHVPVKDEFVHGAIAKYGFLDFAYAAPAGHMPTVDWETGIRLLEELGIRSFSPSEINSDDEFEQVWLEVARDNLQEMNEDIAKNKFYLKVFLTSKEPEVGNQKGTSRIKTLLNMGLLTGLVTVSPTYFPREFVIADACLTNTNLAWFQKRFYL